MCSKNKKRHVKCQSVSLHESILSESTGAGRDGLSMFFERIFVDLKRAPGFPPSESVPHSLDIEADGLVLGHDVLIHLEHVKSDWMS